MLKQCLKQKLFTLYKKNLTSISYVFLIYCSWSKSMKCSSLLCLFFQPFSRRDMLYFWRYQIFTAKKNLIQPWNRKHYKKITYCTSRKFISTKYEFCMSIKTKNPCFFKGTVQQDFRPPFFSSFEHAWTTDRDQLFNTILILVKVLPSYSNFSESPRGVIPRRVNLPELKYSGESSDFSGS